MTPRQIERVQQLNELRTAGALSEEEFEAQKAKALAPRPRWIVPAAVAGATLVLGISAYTGIGTDQHGLIGGNEAVDSIENTSATENGGLASGPSSTSESDVPAASLTSQRQQPSSQTTQDAGGDYNNDETATPGADPCVGYWRGSSVGGGVTLISVTDVSQGGRALYDVSYAVGSPRRMTSGMVFPNELTATVSNQPDSEDADPSAELSNGHLKVGWGNIDSLEMNCDPRTATDGINVWQRISAAQYQSLKRK